MGRFPENGTQQQAPPKTVHPRAVELAAAAFVALIGFFLGSVVSGIQKSTTPRMEIPFPFDYRVEDQWILYRTSGDGSPGVELLEDERRAPKGYTHTQSITQPGTHVGSDRREVRWAFYRRRKNQ